MAVKTYYGSGAQDPALVSTLNPLPAEEVQGRIRHLISTQELANGDSATSTVTFGRVPSNARFVKGVSRLDFDALTGVADFDLGGANDPDCLVDGADIHLAGTADALSAVDIANLKKAFWELQGYTTDPGGDLPVIGTLKAAATAAGTLTLQLHYVTP